MVRVKLFLLFWILRIYSGFVVHAAPSAPAAPSREATSRGFSPNITTESLTPNFLDSNTKFNPLVNASAQIKNYNGIDITSSFQIKIYRQTANPHITNLTEHKDLHDRRGLTTANAVRIINECYTNETFIESHCTPSDDTKAPLQAYVYTCRKSVDHWRAITGEYVGRRPAYRTRAGRCDSTELCVDGFGTRQIASCVHNSLFDDYMTDKDGRLKGMLNGETFNVAKMYAVMSQMDKSVEIKARKLGIIAWNSESVGQGGTVQSKNCVNCVDLETDLLQPGIDSLRIEATMLSAGAAVGILWLAMG